MNDLNLLVSHTLSAVRDAQQQVRDGDLAAGDDAAPMLANFSDVMQGLIALAQTAPQTEDAFDYAKTALLRNLAKQEGDALVDGDADLLGEAVDADQEEGAAALLLEEGNVAQTPAENVLAAAFAPLQETLASLLMLQAPPTLDTSHDGASANDDPSGLPQAQQLQTAGTLNAPVPHAAQKLASAQDAADVLQATQDARQLARQDAAATQNLAALAQSAQNPQKAAALAAPNLTEGRAHQAVDNAPAPSAPNTTAAALPASDASQQLAERSAASAAALASSSDRVTLAAAASAEAAAQAQAAAPASDAQTAQTAQAQTSAAAAAAVAPSEASVVEPTSSTLPALALAPQSETLTDVAPSAESQVGVAARIDGAQAQKPAATSGQSAKQQKAADAARAAADTDKPRPSSTIAERQAARNVQSYQHAMSDQAPAAAAPATPAPAASMVTTFVPAAEAAVIQSTESTGHTVQLPAVALHDLPQDLSNALAAGAKRVRIEINPPSLGSVEVGVHMRDGAVYVSMQAENANVAQHIERHLQDLRAHLKDAGLSLGGFEMSSRGDEAGQQSSHAGNSPHERLWTDDMLQLATDNPTPLHLEDMPSTAVPQQRPGSINVVA